MRDVADRAGLHYAKVVYQVRCGKLASFRDPQDRIHISPEAESAWLIQRKKDVAGPKACSKCGKEKPLNEFYKHKKGKNGRMEICAECWKLTKRQQWARRKREAPG